MNQYKLSEIAKITGITLRKLRTWRHLNYFIPDYNINCGKGIACNCSKENIAEIIIIRELNKHGLSHDKIKKYIPGKTKIKLDKISFIEGPIKTIINLKQIRKLNSI